jgi:hypothetical protein
LGLETNKGNLEKLWLILKQDAIRNQLGKFEYNITEKLEKEVKIM